MLLCSLHQEVSARVLGSGGGTDLVGPNHDRCGCKASIFKVLEASGEANVSNKRVFGTGVARAFPGGRLAHPENRNEEENK